MLYVQYNITTQLSNKSGVAVQMVERSRTSKVSGSCQRLAVHDKH